MILQGFFLCFSDLCKGGAHVLKKDTVNPLYVYFYKGKTAALICYFKTAVKEEYVLENLSAVRCCFFCHRVVDLQSIYIS